MDCYGKPDLDRADTNVFPQALGAPLSSSQLSLSL
jgi:hypothetical protein